MPIEPKSLTGGQEALIGRAHAVTLEQLEIARQIVADQFAFSTGKSQDDAIIAITQILATNYHATVTRAAG